jgi:prephenate dehydratase
MYYVDFDMAAGSAEGTKVLEELKQYASNIRVLGSYEANNEATQ